VADLDPVRRMRVLAAATPSIAGERMTALARGRLGQRARFDVVLRPDWCVMQSGFLIGGMAAIPEADGTRFAFLGALRLPGLRLLDPVLRRPSSPSRCAPSAISSTGSRPADQPAPAVGNVTG
jgi:hypothetical protein